MRLYTELSKKNSFFAISRNYRRESKIQIHHFIFLYVPIIIKIILPGVAQSSINYIIFFLLGKFFLLSW